MLRLNLGKAPAWYDLGHGVRVQCAPLTSGIQLAARSAMVLLDIPKGAESPSALRTVEMVKAIGRAAILAWEGVEEEDGTPAPVTPEGINALLDLMPMYQAFEQAYMYPAMLMASEKKGCAPLPNGTSAGAPDTAAPAVSGAPSALIA